MTLVKFDEPDAHVDTDAAGEPCVVASDRPSRTVLPVWIASELVAAYETNQQCLLCGLLITTVNEAAYISARNRVVHAGRCFAQHLVNSYRFRVGEYRTADTGLTSGEVDRDLDRAIDALFDHGYTVVKAPEMLSVGQRRELQRRVDHAIASAPANIVLDFTATRMADGSGLSSLVRAHHAYVEAVPTGRMYLVGLNEILRDMLQLTRIETLFTIADTFEAAEVIIRER